MRLFAALPVTGEAKSELTALLTEYRATDWPVRWVLPEGLHVTVKFLGTVAPDRVKAVEAALAAAVSGTPSLSFTAKELGAFPTFSRARVLWAGYVAEPALELLAHRVEQACGALGFPVEGRPFHAHVTLGRLREGAALSHLAVRRLERYSPREGFVAEQCILYQSVTGQDGSVYAPVATFPLGS